MLTIATTWGITGPQFLVGYGVICLVAAIVIRRRWSAALGPPDRSPLNDPLPDLGLYKLAMLAGGPQLAITTAATKLHQDGILTAEDGRLELVGELATGADRLERAVADAVRREPGISAPAMRAELADSEPVQWLADELTQTGLLVDASQVRRVRRLWIVGALLGLLGIARIAAGLINGAPVGWLVVMVGLVLFMTVWLTRQPIHATNRGRAMLVRQQREHDELRHNPVAGEVALTAALFGGGALWLAEPAMASSLGVPREEEWRWSGGGGGSPTCAASSGCASGGGSSCGGGGCGGGCGGGGN
jgi:uncharacterized protein (TIGR04222 family)